MFRCSLVVIGIILVVALLGAVPGCGDGSTDDPTPAADARAGTGSDGAVPDAAAPDSGPAFDAAPADPDASVAPPPITNHPEIEIVDVPRGRFRLVASALRFTSAPGATYVRWVARLENVTDSMQCGAHVDAWGLDRSGAELFIMRSFLRGNPYVDGFRRTRCIPPGGRTFLATIRLVEGFERDQLAAIRVEILGGPTETAVPDPLTPTLVSTELRGDDTVVAGVLRNDTGVAIGGITLEVFPIQPDGLTQDPMTDSMSERLEPGESVEFETLPYDEGTIADYSVFFLYLRPPT